MNRNLLRKKTRIWFSSLQTPPKNWPIGCNEPTIKQEIIYKSNKRKRFDFRLEPFWRVKIKQVWSDDTVSQDQPTHCRISASAGSATAKLSRYYIMYENKQRVRLPEEGKAYDKQMQSMAVELHRKFELYLKFPLELYLKPQKRSRLPHHFVLALRGLDIQNLI